VSIVDENGAPLQDANVKIWSVVGNDPYQATLLVDTFTDSNGQISFA
jgi:protocatechuate 3,4-dioxygenase beta subunit